MRTGPSSSSSDAAAALTAGPGRSLPLVSVVFLSYNRRQPLLESLRRTLVHSGYPPARLDVSVVDNASSDGTAEAVAREFPEVRVIRNPTNAGAPGWNRGFQTARGDYVLILDDDAYLRPGALERAVRAAIAQDAGLVSFSVVSSFDESRRLNDDWRTGLLSFWGCAALISAPALRALGGYDPRIFIWGNEVELTMRLLDHGFRHLHLPDVYAVHMKERIVAFEPHRYLVNARHHGYIAGKLMRRADALATVGNIISRAVVDALVVDRAAIGAVGQVCAGFAAGVRRRRPVRAVVSTTYRRNFHPFSAPWQFMRTPDDRMRSRRDVAVADARRERWEAYWAQRAAFYPTTEASLLL
ncbi:MAG: glycosyltransferase family 2 protein [Solirubrobacteraceae bacterium]